MNLKFHILENKKSANFIPKNSQIFQFCREEKTGIMLNFKDNMVNNFAENGMK